MDTENALVKIDVTYMIFSLMILVVKSRFKADPWYKNYLSSGKVGKKYFKQGTGKTYTTGSRLFDLKNNERKIYQLYLIL